MTYRIESKIFEHVYYDYLNKYLDPQNEILTRGKIQFSHKRLIRFSPISVNMFIMIINKYLGPQNEILIRGKIQVSHKRIIRFSLESVNMFIILL